MKYSIVDFIELFKRDLNRLKTEVENINSNHLWETSDGITNSCGVLVQHLAGNLNHFIGTALGGTGYVRNREREFTNTGVSADILIADITATIEMINTVLSNLDEETLAGSYPMEVSGDYTTYQFILHLYGHLNYHLGQVNYLRRILDKNKG